jgi:DNA (cytosine-5)-methyltransferase 1
LRVCSLFSGIGGFELGLQSVGYETILVCDNDPAARAVLRRRFPDLHYRKDVTSIKNLPKCELLTAGWPCQDLSQAGSMAGIEGKSSRLVNEVFRLIEGAKTKPTFVLLENVAFSLHLQGGRAIKSVARSLESQGYKWAYRILNTREFGLPQRRRRVFIVGSLQGDPLSVLFDGIAPQAHEPKPERVGFYWTEGNRGIGWSPELIPPLKGGSGLSIPSPPAIWDRKSRLFFSPGIEDAERLQGFRAGWTSPVADIGLPDRVRWRLVGNAVSIPIVKWIGRRLAAFNAGRLENVEFDNHRHTRRENLGWGERGQKAREIHVANEGPARAMRVPISDFEFRGTNPLSQRAAAGFLERLVESPLQVEPRFLIDLARYCGRPDLIAGKAA